MPKLTLNKLCELVGMDRRAVTPLLDAVPYTEGPNNSHLYETTEALPAIYKCRHNNKGPESTLAEAKIRNELAAARLREIAAKQKLEELVPAEFARMAIDAFIKFVAQRFEELRRRGFIDSAWIQSCQSRFYDILADLTLKHGLEFGKAILKPEHFQTLEALVARVEQPTQGPPA